MRVQEAYQTMATFMKEGYTRQAALYKTARQFGMSPRDLGLLLQSPTQTKSRRKEEKRQVDEQLMLEL